MKMTYKIALVLTVLVCGSILGHDLYKTHRAGSDAQRVSGISDRSSNGLRADGSGARFGPKPVAATRSAGSDTQLSAGGDPVKEERLKDDSASEQSIAKSSEAVASRKPNEIQPPTLTFGLPLVRSMSGHPSRRSSSSLLEEDSATRRDVTAGKTRRRSRDTGVSEAGRDQGGQRYTIRPGDTFSSIAVMLFGSEQRWVDLAHANPLVDPTRLEVGQVIVLPAPDSARASVGRDRPMPGKNVHHMVRPGESLSTISSLYYRTPERWREIFQANSEKIGPNPNRLRVGMILKIPPLGSSAEVSSR